MFIKINLFSVADIAQHPKRDEDLIIEVTQVCLFSTKSLYEFINNYQEQQNINLL